MLTAEREAAYRRSRAKIQRLRRKVIKLAAELGGLKQNGHASVAAVESRLNNVGKALLKEWFEFFFGVKLSSGKVGPKDEDHKRWGEI